MSCTKDKNLPQLLDGKIVVVDTSSLLISGTQLLSNIGKCKLVIPAVVVQELENKRDHMMLGYFSRQWINLLEELRLKDGILLSLGVMHESGVKIRVEPNHSNQKSLPTHLQDHSRDSTVLSVAVNFSNEEKLKDDSVAVAVLSNDTPMRLHATLELNLEAYEFGETEKETPFTGRLTVALTTDEYEKLPISKNINDLAGIVELIPAQRPARALIDILLEGETVSSALLDQRDLTPIERGKRYSGIAARTIEQEVAFSYLSRHPRDLPIVSIAGNAGTGKTLLSVALALELLRDNQSYDCYQKIVVFRSLHEMGQGQELGFLPGGVDDKMEVWGGAISDALDVIAAAKKPQKKNDGPGAHQTRKELSEKMWNDIELSPITFLRGRSLSNSFIILDEAQNFSRNELLNIISRVGENSKIVLLSDAAQVDNKYLKTGDEAEIWSLIKDLKNRDIFAHITLARTERSQIAEIASELLAR
jgi:PhoH-like ATPase